MVELLSFGKMFESLLRLLFFANFGMVSRIVLNLSMLRTLLKACREFCLIVYSLFIACCSLDHSS